MRANAWQDTSRANWIDYLLCWFSSALAVFSCGQAVASNMVSIFGVVAVTIGTGLSYIVRVKLGNTAFSKLDGFLYCIVAWGAVLGAKSINASIFPDETFPIELTPSAWLLWMTIFGSFFCWRDGTIIFHCIPALAVFGFVGCYDTFKYVVFFFFLFLICFATLFARAHGREMQERAVNSGYFRLGQSHHLTPSEASSVLREGPWRWAAGAEWALGSALIIVVLSLIGAPVIQATAKPLSGIVTVRAPRLRNATPSAAAQNVPTSAPVGSGPVSLSDTPYYEVSGAVPEYLKIASFNTWTGKTWVASSDTNQRLLINRLTGAVIGVESPSALDSFKLPNKKPGQYWDDYRTEVMKVKALISTREILQSGNNPMFSSGRPADMKGPNMALVSPDRYDGTLTYDKIPSLTKDSKPPKIIDSWLRSNLDYLKPSDELRVLAEKATAGISGDYQKALAIQAEVTKRIKYNTRASAVPDGKDAAEYALFESHEGYCDLFATCMTRMARIIKIPARYTIGYLPDTKNRNDRGTQTILESDRHAWAELYFEGVGWVPFDATAGAEVVPGGGRRDNKPTDSATVLRIIGQILNVLIVVAVISGVAIYFRLSRIPKTGSMIRSELDVEYVKFIGAIWKYTGHRRLLSETTTEYLKRVGPDIGAMQVKAEEIGVQFTNIMFGPTEVSPADVETARESVQHFRDELSKQPKVQSKKLVDSAVVHQPES